MASKAFFEAFGGVFEASWGAFWASWEPLGSILGASLEPLGAILSRLGAKLGGLGATFGALRVLYDFLERFGEQKGCPEGGILGAKTEPKSIQYRGANLRAKKSPLGVVLVRFGVDFQGVSRSKMLIFHWFLKFFVDIHVSADECPRAT